MEPATTPADLIAQAQVGSKGALARLLDGSP
jgi:hypothetical protein